MEFIDTHAHLDDEQFAEDIDSVLERARRSGVTRIINIGYRPRRWQSTMRLAERNSMVSFTLGLHPHHADEWSTDTKRELEALLDSTGAVAVGEIGIDLYRDGPPTALQQRVFAAQLDIAAARRLPVVIHQRAAEAELLVALRSAPPGLVCVLHSFEGSSDLAAMATERGHLLGVGGLMARKSAGPLRDTMSAVPLDRLILETDSPYLAPPEAANRRNEPANIPLIAKSLALLRNESVADIAFITTQNAQDVFGLPASAS
jgi:TatD DNase family protein